MDKSIVTRKIASKKALVTKSPRVIDDLQQPVLSLARQLNHDNTHWPKPVTGSVVACKMC